MKKSTLGYLIIIMALAIMGLLYLQLMYLRSMVTMRNDQFNESVRRSLYAVATHLERDEARYFLEEDIENMEAQFVPSKNNFSGTLSQKYNFTTREGIQYNIVQKSPLSLQEKFNSMREVIRGQYLYQKGLLDEVILSIITESSHRPVSERADTALVRSYLASELANNGIELPFDFAITNRVGAPYMATSGYQRGVTDDNEEVFSQMLFSNDPVGLKIFLKVAFPDKEEFIQDSVKFILPSLIFTVVLIITFVITLIVAVRQKKLNKMKTDFINNMTHEFKTPISSISLAGQMLNDPAVTKSPTMLAHISSVINDETKRLRFQVEKVLQMSMFDRKNASLRLSTLNVDKLIESIAHTFKLKVEKYGGQLTTHLDAKDAECSVDEMHFTNVIFNLLDNAVKYRQEDVPPHLTITTSNPTNHTLQIMVADNGIGLKKEDLKRIFEKFYRVSTGNRHDVKGFGLGLAYVQKIVASLGGSIRVESELGKGSQFIITLPLSKSDKE